MLLLTQANSAQTNFLQWANGFAQKNAPGDFLKMSARRARRS